MLAAIAPRPAQLERRCSDARRRARAISRASRLIWRQDCHALPTERERSASGTASAIPPSRAAASPAATRTRRRSRRASSSSATSTRSATSRRCPQPEVLGRNGTYVVFRKLHQRRGRVPPVPARPRRRRRGARSCWPPRSSGAGAAARRSRSRPTTTTPSWAPTRRATTTSSTGRRPERGLQVPDRLAHPADEPARRDRHRRRAAAPDDPARHQLRARSCPKACWRTTAPTAACASSSSARTWTGSSSSCRRSGSTTGAFFGAPGREGPAHRPERRRPARSPSPRGRSAGGCTDLPRFVVTRGGEYCFAPSLTGAALARGAQRPARTQGDVQHALRRRTFDQHASERSPSHEHRPPTPPPSSPAGACATAWCPR